MKVILVQYRNKYCSPLTFMYCYLPKEPSSRMITVKETFTPVWGTSLAELLEIRLAQTKLNKFRGGQGLSFSDHLC